MARAVADWSLEKPSSSSRLPGSPKEPVRPKQRPEKPLFVVDDYVPPRKLMKALARKEREGGNPFDTWGRPRGHPHFGIDMTQEDDFHFDMYMVLETSSAESSSYEDDESEESSEDEDEDEDEDDEEEEDDDDEDEDEDDSSGEEDSDENSEDSLSEGSTPSPRIFPMTPPDYPPPSYASLTSPAGMGSPMPSPQSPSPSVLPSYDSVVRSTLGAPLGSLAQLGVPPPAVPRDSYCITIER
jgi:hypothetical protein